MFSNTSCTLYSLTLYTSKAQNKFFSDCCMLMQNAHVPKQQAIVPEVHCPMMVLKLSTRYECNSLQACHTSSVQLSYEQCQEQYLNSAKFSQSFANKLSQIMIFWPKLWSFFKPTWRRFKWAYAVNDQFVGHSEYVAVFLYFSNA